MRTATIGAGPKNHGLEPCPICGQTGAQEWLRGPDRFHGRREQYTLVRCPACSLVWLSNPPKPSEMHLHYTDAYHKLISAAGENSPDRWEDRKAALTPYKQSGALLDLGCSSGSFLEFLRSESWKLYGIEMSAECARTRRQRASAQVFVGDILDAPFRRESFDVITCFDVLEHLYEPRRVMATRRRVAEARRNFLCPGAQRGLCRGARVWKLLAWAGAAATPVPLFAGISQISRRIGRTSRGVAGNTAESRRGDQPALRVG